MLRSLLTTLALLVASLAAAVVFTGDEAFWTAGAGAMVASGHLVLTAIVIVAALVGSARWSRGLGIALAASLAIPAMVHPITPAWWLMVLAAGTAGSLLAANGLRATVRLRPSATAPPRKAAVLALGLVAVPVVVGGLQPGGVDVADWLAAMSGPVMGLWYAQARAGAVWLVRLGTPALIGVLLIVVPFPRSAAAAAAAGVLVALAWSSDARIAVRPLASPGRAVPIPPELAPQEILDAAGLDERGRRRERE